MKINIDMLKHLFHLLSDQEDVSMKKYHARRQKSKINMFTFRLKNGEQIQVSCNDWSKEKESENWWDQLKVVIFSLDYMEYLELIEGESY